MFLKRLNRLRRSLAFRLTLWYAGIFSISAFLAFIFFYFQMIEVLRNQVDDDLTRQLRALAGIMQVDGLTGVRQVALQEAQAGGTMRVSSGCCHGSGRSFRYPIVPAVVKSGWTARPFAGC